MVYEESVRCGKVLGIAVPVPPPDVADAESSRVYIKFSTSAEAGKCKEMMDGRLFDDKKVGILCFACLHRGCCLSGHRVVWVLHSMVVWPMVACMAG